MTAILFPGQGSQYIGMSEDFYNNFLNSKLVFEEVEDSTSIDVKKIIFIYSSSIVIYVDFIFYNIYS